jgi:hypothetical protein
MAQGIVFALVLSVRGMLNFECVFACILFMHSYRCHPHNAAPQGVEEQSKKVVEMEIRKEKNPRNKQTAVAFAEDAKQVGKCKRKCRKVRQIKIGNSMP